MSPTAPAPILPLSPTLLAFVTVATSYLAWLLFTSPASVRHRMSQSKIPDIVTKSFFPRLGAIDFYTRRDAFLADNMGNPLVGDKLKPAVKFNIKGHVVIAASGPDAARTFYQSRKLGFSNAYKVMFAGGPLPPTTAGHEGDEQGSFLIQSLKHAIRTERLKTLTTRMVDDCLDCFVNLPGAVQGGGFDTHKVIFPLIFQLSVRTVGTNEIADDMDKVCRMERLYWMVEDAGYVTTHLPFLPLPGIIKRAYGGYTLYNMNLQTITTRIRQGRREDDAVQEMIDAGSDPKKIALFIVGTLFAAVLNSASMASWILLFIGADPEFRERVQREIDETLRRSAEQRGDDYDSLTTSERLRHVTLADWEDGFPLIEAALKETMRILMTATGFRVYEGNNARGANKEAPIIDGEELVPGDFVAFWMGSVHQNSNVYKHPLKFDPDRWARGEGKENYEFVGWGAGLHPCTGMRFAKLEMKVVVTSFLSVMNYSSTDLAGADFDADSLPRTDTAKTSHSRKPIKPVLLNYRLRDNYVPPN